MQQTSGWTVQRSAFLLLSACAGLMGAGLIYFEGDTTQTSRPALVTRINPNTASLGELLNLPGIGPARAQAIISYRETHVHAPAFACLEDLHQVKGLGPALVRDMASWLCLDEAPVK